MLYSDRKNDKKKETTMDINDRYELLWMRSTFFLYFFQSEKKNKKTMLNE